MAIKGLTCRETRSVGAIANFGLRKCIVLASGQTVVSINGQVLVRDPNNLIKVRDV
jgi:hypothetical protein